MSVFTQLLSRFNRRRPRRKAEPHAVTAFLATSRWVTAMIFVTTVAAIVFISSVGVNTGDLPVLPNQLANVRITAAVPFTYESREKTQLAREQILERVPPVYRLESEPLNQFEQAIREMQSGLVALGSSGEKRPDTEIRHALLPLLETFNARGLYRASLDDVELLFTKVPADRRAVLFESGVGILREIYAEGVHDDSLVTASSGRFAVFQIARGDGEVTMRHVQSVEEALTFLRVNLSGEDMPRDVTLALFRLLRNGVTPNLIFDRAATARREQAAIAELKPVVVGVARGQTIIEPGTRVTNEQYEMFIAHRQTMRDSGASQLDESLQLFGRVLLVLAMVLASVFYIRLEDRETFQSNGRLGLLALVVILNISLVRTVFALGSLDFFITHGTWASTLPYIAASAFAPLIVAILIDAGSAIFMALFISIFTGVIYGNRLDLLVITFLASTVAIFACRDVRRRGRVVRAAGLGGLTVAIFALLVGLADQLPFPTLLQQFGAGLASGVITGVIVVGLLPMLESLFQRTTDITLLELTDYNHPLLRRMQLEAPGTYHHSLVVAQLAENACNAIGANPLRARVCALFHDIGKTNKPEYFIENQRTRGNPHDESNPSLSALIIKSHVKDGVDLARKHHLPKAVIDVIQQHHGTSLIRYFYHRAVTHSQGSMAPFQRPDSKSPLPPGLEPSAVSESTYRYDGPIPQFKESAVILLADGVEAATRTLRKVTPQSLGELIDALFRERIEDGQLDESPLTFVEIAKIKSSFTFTLLNMLHARIEYPTESAAGAGPAKA